MPSKVALYVAIRRDHHAGMKMRELECKYAGLDYQLGGYRVS
ncbi:hypothetical protein ACFYPK_31785 [Streptomyces halstedii]